MLCTYCVSELSRARIWALCLQVDIFNAEPTGKEQQEAAVET